MYYYFKKFFVCLLCHRFSLLKKSLKNIFNVNVSIFYIFEYFRFSHLSTFETCKYKIEKEKNETKIKARKDRKNMFESNFDAERLEWSNEDRPNVFNGDISLGEVVLWSLKRNPTKIGQVN